MTRPVYINGSGIISPSHRWDGNSCVHEEVKFAGNRLNANEPDYSRFIDAKQIRRMSRVIRMGVTTSQLALKEAGIAAPDAIIAGTALGCLEDTYSFLSNMTVHAEEMLSPTAFIHSTHNTIAAQIALQYKCYGYNSTYVHRNLSFESALTDACLLIEEGTAENVLVGGVDELIDASFHIMQLLGVYSSMEETGLGDFYSGRSSGVIAGEGSAFFILSPAKSQSSYAKINEIFMSSFENEDQIIEKLKHISNDAELTILAGHNGSGINDSAIDNLIASAFDNNSVVKYKHQCGEYGTASAYALWLATDQIRRGQAERIGIFHHIHQLHTSFILLEKC
jgi:3-oxoacyl-[acyl-carrier-protein] synthase II